MKYVISVTLLFAATTAWAQTPAASTTEPDRWAPWMGCWQVVDESVEDVEKLLSTLSTSPSASKPGAGARVCVTPSAEGGATMTTIVSGKTVLAETIVADGTARPLADANCRGTQQAEWSALGPRIYARTDVSCGDQPTRTISGFSAVVSGPLWIDIQMVESEGRKSLRVRRYQRAADQRGAASNVETLGRMPLGGKVSLADIKEASTKLAPEALQAVVLELGTGGYDLNAKRLIELDEAGIPDSVIDLMVAMSFPRKFIVERAVPTSGPGGLGIDDDYGLWGPFSMWSPLSMWGYYAHPRYYSSYYSPFGYYNWGYYDPYYYGYPGVVILNPGGGGSGTPQPTGTGRVVDGQGYTRIRPNNPEPIQRAGNGGWGGNSGSSAGSSGGSSSGGSVSTGGYSGGGGGGGERVAVPRPPGLN